MNGDYHPVGSPSAESGRMPSDTQFEDSTITRVDGDAEHGWSITKADGWSFYVPKESPVVPAVGMAVRMYGRGIGSRVRGLFLAGELVFYRTEAGDEEHFANEMYGKDAADLLSRWDGDRGVWSISMGGFGPSYEQALQVAAFEVLRHLLSGGDIEKAEDILPSLSYLGLSGAQWGGARSLALAFHKKGPRAVHEMYDRDRHIQVNKNFPSPDRAALLDRIEELEAFVNSFHLTVLDNQYKDVALHLDQPHALSIRIPNNSDKSWIFADLEARRKALSGEKKP